MATLQSLLIKIGIDTGDVQRGMDRTRSLVGRAGAALGVAAGVAGAGAGALLAKSLTDALDQGQIVGRLGAQLGLSAKESARMGKIAGDLYSANYGDSMEQVAEAIKEVRLNVDEMNTASAADLKAVTGNVLTLAKAFGQDLGGTSRAVGQMIRTGLAGNAREALDILTAGFQKGGDKAGDLLDTVNEYGTQFRKLGMDGKQAMGIITQGLKAGARDADIVADAIKEFSIRAVDGSKTTAEGFQMIGLNAGDMAKRIGAGGASANKALDLTLDRLRGIEDPVKRSQAAVALFGTQAEDLGDALLALDPSQATQLLGNVAGAADRAGKALSDNAGAKLTAFTRTVQQGIVEFLGGQAVPVLEQFIGWLGALGAGFARASTFVDHNRTTFIAAAAVITTLMLPTLLSLAVTATTTGASVMAAWALMSAAAARSAAMAVAANVRTLASWVMLGGGATAHAARVGAAWAMMGARATAGAAMQLASATRVVAGWVLMGVQSLAQAARMAAAWIIAMGPLGWVIAAVIAVVVLIVKNWDTVKRWTAAAWQWVWSKIKQVGKLILDFFLNWTIVGRVIKHWDQIKAKTSAAWNAVMAFVKAIPGKLVSFFLNWTIVGRVIKHWDQIKTGTISKAGQMVAWVRGLPGRITGALGNLGSLLYGKGQAVVRGLWNGISAMSGWLRSTLIGWARNLIPGPIARALGIASPSKVMARQIGRWIPAGIVEGIHSGQRALERAMATLVPMPQLPPAPAMAGAPAPGTPGAGGLHIEHYHESDSGGARATARELLWLAKGRG